MDSTELINRVEEHIANNGKVYTAGVFHKLKARGKRISQEEAEVYNIIQKAHLRLTGHSLPALAGAIKTSAQHRDEKDISIDENKIEAAVKGGLAAKIALLRSNK